VLPWESRLKRRKVRAPRRPELDTLESLEGRELLAYTPLGFSLPDLSVQAFAGPAASWGNPLTVTVNVKNTGASTLIEPLALVPGATSTADAQPTTVVVSVSSREQGSRSVPIGAINIPVIRQNDVEQFTATFTLPNRPSGFPNNGTVFLHAQVNPNRNVLETDYTNNISNTATVLIQPAFPQLQAVGLDVPPYMQPGDTIQPNIHIANLGPVSTAAQGPVTVALVASVDRKFGPGSSVIATYQIANIPGINNAPTKNTVFGQPTLEIQNNIATINGAAVTLPVRPRTYFIGVVIDPSNQLRQLGRIGKHAATNLKFSLIHQVGPPLDGLPPAGVIVAGGGATNRPFPFPIRPGTIVGNPVTRLPTNPFV